MREATYDYSKDNMMDEMRRWVRQNPTRFMRFFPPVETSQCFAAEILGCAIQATEHFQSRQGGQRMLRHPQFQVPFGLARQLRTADC